MIQFIIDQIIEVKTTFQYVYLADVLGLEFFPLDFSLWDLSLGLGFTAILVNIFRGLGLIGDDEDIEMED